MPTIRENPTSLGYLGLFRQLVEEQWEGVNPHTPTWYLYKVSLQTLIHLWNMAHIGEAIGSRNSQPEYKNEGQTILGFIILDTTHITCKE